MARRALKCCQFMGHEGI